jgi:hypothetical protein
MNSKFSKIYFDGMKRTMPETSAGAGLPDFSWYNIPWGKIYVPDNH